MKNFMIWLLLILGAAPYSQAQFGNVKLIAHRGGVVDGHTDENSLVAIKKAAEQGYYMVELDVRLTKDRMLVVHHDRDLKRFFNVDKVLADLTWAEVQGYTSANGHQIQKLEAMLAHCKSEGLQVMIDLKVPGNDQEAFAEIYRMLLSRGLTDQALIIPSAEATDYFRGKIKLSCTREQVEAYQTREDYSPTDYYLFANPSPQDFDWAKAHHIQVVGAINYRASGAVDYAALAKELIDMGVQYVQLDSRFATYFVEKHALFFNQQGQFKIAQFTDLHWDQYSANTEKTISTMRAVLDSEKPDLVVLTGDLPASRPASAAWDVIARIFEEYQIPWTITLGNHDEEVGMTRKENFEYLQNKPFFIGSKGSASSGAGNYVLPVYASSGDKIRALIYALDTHNKPADRRHGHYNWVQFDQIAWYREQSEYFSDRNNGSPLPALAFLHIPLVEYGHLHREPGSFLGNASRGDGPGGLNSGLFVSFLEKKDVMGVFAGHNHSNDYIGKYMDVALAYGRTTGADAYGTLERGARIIVLQEGKRSFDTWIKTPSKMEFKYYYPSGIAEIEEKEMVYQDAEEALNLLPGIRYRYYEGQRFESIADIALHGRLVKSDVLENIRIDMAAVQDSFAVEFEGYIRIPQDGVYNFYTFSDDGSQLWIGDMLVVDNDGSHNERRRDGKIALKKGFHKFLVKYFDDYMGEILEVGISAREIPEQAIPNDMLYREDGR